MLLARLLRSRPNPTGSRRSEPAAATPENPSFNLNSAEAWDALGASPTATGQSVNPEKVLTWSAWWRGVTLLARGVAKCPCHIYVVEPNGQFGATVALSHPAYRLLRWKPNEYQTALQFRLALAGHAINRGNGYAYIFRSGPDAAELVLLDPDDTEPVMVGGRLWYVTKVDGAERKLPAADVFHLRGFGCDGIRGYPLWQMARESISLGLTAEKFRGSRYKNAARPSVVLTTDAKLSDPAKTRLAADWERMHTGFENAHRTALLDNGLKVSTLSFSPEQMQEVESAGLSLRDAANFLGIPSSKLGDVQGVKYASKEQDDRNYLEDGLDFWLCAFEDEGREKLLLESEKDANTRVVSFDRDALVSFDLAAKASYYRTATGGRGWMSPAEVREKEKLEPRQEPDIDKILTPLNMGQGGADNKPDDLTDPEPGRPAKGQGDEAANGNKPAPPAPVANKPTPAAAAAAALALSTSAKKLVKRVAFHALRTSRDATRFVAFVESLEAEHRAVFRSEFLPAERAAAAARPDARPTDGEAADWLLAVLVNEYNAVANDATTKTLAPKVAALVADQEGRLPRETVHIFLEGTGE